MVLVKLDLSVLLASVRVLRHSVAQSCTLSVSVQIVAGRDDFAERGSVSRSTSVATDALDLSKRWVAGKAPAGHRPALLWLRLRRAVLYRRVALCKPLETADAWDRSDALPTASRRYGRLKICTTNLAPAARHPAGTKPARRSVCASRAAGVACQRDA
jgi:hypothetical protein